MRRRGLSEADRALWRVFAQSVRPLRGRPAPEAPPPPPAAVQPAEAPPAARAAPAPQPAAAPPRTPPIEVGIAPPGLDGKRWTALRRGALRPERTLDLHGRRVQEAHGALRAFLHEAQADGLRCVAVVTGKGSAPEGGVIRRELPHWLNAPELRRLILGAAHPHSPNPQSPNAGAVHLLLRRAGR